ncbi:tetratricopeptide repeat protein [Ekhidna sp.]|uniref:tetratricopeptide repeat protein n=1 Tax=Ekhidna sp. TaxID=2608089 RepID=UPI003CCBAEEF
MKKIITTFLLITCLQSVGQVFNPGPVQNLVKKASDHIYNAKPDSAEYYISKAERYLPEHPVIPLMRAMSILWSEIPLISEEEFAKMEFQLDSAISLARFRDPDLEQPEMIFFAMASYGLLAEYYADQGYMMKAVSEANRAYGLMKKGFDIVDDYPEFLLTTGLYNYFREKYPEKHPMYKPLLWFFRSGDMEKGLKQLEQACNESFLTKVEAYVYLSYIYLRYEYKPDLAQNYLSALCEMYPNNFYAKAKYLESMANPEDFKDAPLDDIHALITHESPYYKLAGYVFLGYFEEKIIKNDKKAEHAYRTALKYAEEIPNHGEFFKSFGYLGLSRILVKTNRKEEARVNLEKALTYAETEQIESEAEKLLSVL